MGKKITVSLSIILICTITFINGYTFVYPSYADSTTEQWTSVTTNEELAQAFEYYCKSRNLFIDGSVLGSATKFTTQSFDNICDNIGINMSALQANIKKSTDKNGGLQFLFDTNGITAYNRIFAEFLQNHDLQEGDTVQNDVVYSGELVEDADGNTALVFYVEKLDTLNDSNNSNYLTAVGSLYKYNNQQLVNMANIVADSTTRFNIPYKDNQGEKNIYTRCTSGSSYTYINTNDPTYGNNGGLIFYRTGSKTFNHGYLTIAKYSGNYYVGIFSNFYINRIGYDNVSRVNNKPNWRYANSFVPVKKDNADVYITTNNNTINSNTYTDNRQTVINNEGDVYNYDYDDDDPPINPPPSTVTPPSDSGGSDGDVSFPDFNFQLPEINWSLGDLSEKFPFSIPFDLIAFFTVLNAEPQAPSIDANIPLGSWYTWHFTADFSQFDNWATIIRNVEFIAFCIGLIYLTIRLVKG